MMTRDQAAQAAQQLTKTLRTYRGTEYHAELVRLLQALREFYMHDLLDMDSGSAMERIQGAAKQCLALERALNSDTADSPRI